MVIIIKSYNIYIYSRVPLLHSPIQRNTAVITAVTEGGYKSDFEPIKYIPYLTLMGQLWDVFCEDLGKIDCIKITPHCMFILPDMLTDTCCFYAESYQCSMIMLYQGSLIWNFTVKR